MRETYQGFKQAGDARAAEVEGTEEKKKDTVELKKWIGGEKTVDKDLVIAELMEKLAKVEAEYAKRMWKPGKEKV